MAAKSFSSAHLRRLVQTLTIFFWLTGFVVTASLAWGPVMAWLPVRLDPLLVAARSIAGRGLTDGWFLALLLPLSALVFGRAWCGWVCPVGTVLDVFPFKKKRNSKTLSQSLRKGKYFTLLAILIAACLGNLSLLIFDPITLWIRTLTGGIWPAFDRAFTAVEYALAEIPWMVDGLTRLDQAVRPILLAATPPGARLIWLPVAVFGVIILFNLLAERFWCRYLCPLGGGLGWISHLAIFKREVSADCKGCGVCSTACPTGTIDPARKFASDPAECTLCMDCVSACPTRQVRFGFSKPKIISQVYDPGRRDLLAAGAVSLAGLAVVDADQHVRSTSAHLLRPPGVNDANFLQVCLRCGLCSRTCPTGAIQSSLGESGLSGLFTPVLIPRLGYCLYSCNQCGQVCPVEAIPALSLAEKQTTVIGKAFIDENRCIPYTESKTCIVCEEMCPLPEKAITLREEQIIGPDGAQMAIQFPTVDREICIGCGICEYKCPRAGEAAIRVYRLDGTDRN